jgi:hypothetical protein
MKKYPRLRLGSGVIYRTSVGQCVSATLLQPIGPAVCYYPDRSFGARRQSPTSAQPLLCRPGQMPVLNVGIRGVTVTAAGETVPSFVPTPQPA